MQHFMQSRCFNIASVLFLEIEALMHRTLHFSVQFWKKFSLVFLRIKKIRYSL